MYSGVTSLPMPESSFLSLSMVEPDVVSIFPVIIIAVAIKIDSIFLELPFLIHYLLLFNSSGHFETSTNAHTEESVFLDRDRQIIWDMKKSRSMKEQEGI